MMLKSLFKSNMTKEQLLELEQNEEKIKREVEIEKKRRMRVSSILKTKLYRMQQEETLENDLNGLKVTCSN